MRSMFQALGKAVVLCLLGVILFMLIALGESSIHEDMDKRASLKAFCDSVNGSLGGDRCFVDGVEVKQ